MAISRGFPPTNTISPSVRITEKDFSYYGTQPSSHRAAIVGFASKGPIGIPTLVGSVRDLNTIFGYPHPDISDPYMIYAAQQYLAFSTECYIVRIAVEDPVNSEAARVASVEVPSAGLLAQVVAANAGPYDFYKDAFFRWKLNGILASKVLRVPGGPVYDPITHLVVTPFTSYPADGLGSLSEVLNAQLDFAVDGIHFTYDSTKSYLVLSATWAFGPLSTIEIMSVQDSMTGWTLDDEGPNPTAAPLQGSVQFGTNMTNASVTGDMDRYPESDPVGSWTFEKDVLLYVVTDGTDNVLIDNVVQIVTIPHLAPSTVIPMTYTLQDLCDAINNDNGSQKPGGWMARPNGAHMEIVTKHCGQTARLLVKSTGTGTTSMSGGIVFGLPSTTAYGTSPSDQTITPIDNRATLGIISGALAGSTDYTFNLLADSTGTEGNLTNVVITNDTQTATFTMSIYSNGQQVESWGMLSKDQSSSYYLEPFLAAYSDYIRVEDNLDDHSPPADSGVLGYQLFGGTDGIPADPDDQDALIIGSSGSYSGLYSLSEPEQIDIDLLAVPGHSSTYVILAMQDLCENYRQDCMFIVDPPFGLTPREIVQWQNGTSPLNNTRFDSDFGALYWPWVKISDTYNRIPMWVPPSGCILAVYANSDNISAPWFAPAGETRGVVSGITDVFSRPTLAERDDMYGNRNCINPIVQFADNTNYLVWGQKTLQRRPTALDRVNVRRMMFYIEKRIRSGARKLLFDPIDANFVSQFTSMANSVLAAVQVGRGIYASFVLADSSLNTPDTIDRNEFRARIGVQPTKAAEFILLEFAIFRTGTWSENA